jgi:hypothetical protein
MVSPLALIVGFAEVRRKEVEKLTLSFLMLHLIDDGSGTFGYKRKPNTVQFHYPFENNSKKLW